MRITFSIVMFYVWFIASAALLETAGVFSALGVSGATTAGESFQQATMALNDLRFSGLAVESLVSVYLVISNAVQGFVVALTAGPRLFVNLGIPVSIVAFVHAPIALLAGRFAVYAVSGRDF